MARPGEQTVSAASSEREPTQLVRPVAAARSASGVEDQGSLLRGRSVGCDAPLAMGSRRESEAKLQGVHARLAPPSRGDGTSVNGKPHSGIVVFVAVFFFCDSGRMSVVESTRVRLAARRQCRSVVM